MELARKRVDLQTKFGVDIFFNEYVCSAVKFYCSLYFCRGLLWHASSCINYEEDSFISDIYSLHLQSKLISLLNPER